MRKSSHNNKRKRQTSDIEEKKIEYTFDILCSDDTANRFIDCYKDVLMTKRSKIKEYIQKNITETQTDDNSLEFIEALTDADTRALTDVVSNIDTTENADAEDNIDMDKSNTNAGGKKQELIRTIKQVVEKHYWEKIDYKTDYNSGKFKLGDTIKVSYAPASQKYIDYYCDEGFTGKIIFIDEKDDNMFVFVEKQAENGALTRLITSLKKSGCHYFGMSLSYTCIIEKVPL